MKETTQIFGAALDALDGTEKVDIKRAYVSALINHIEINPNYLDPYEAISFLNPGFSANSFEKIGKVPIETWLTPKPLIRDLSDISSEKYKAFLESNGCRRYADLVGDYMNGILPSQFIMLGVDHSQTGGVVRKLAQYYGKDQISVIVLDAHTDMFDYDLLCAAQIRFMEREAGFYLPSFSEAIAGYQNRFYGCGNFLKALIDENVILPENLFLIGVTDYPTRSDETEDDPAITRYIDSYMGILEQGVKIFSKREVESAYETIMSVLKNIKTQYVYVSVDMDVGAFVSTSAVRFPNTLGMTEELIYRTVGSIKASIDSNNIYCVGLDLMEIDVHFAGYPRRGVTDRAYDVASNIISIMHP
jgi:arginase family enzyme